MDALLDYAEEQARTVIRSLPDGDYFFADYADEDSVGGKPCRIALTLKINDGSLILDYTGSDPQMSSSLNMPTGGRERHVLLLVGLTYILYTLNPNILLNAGMLRPARCIVPQGTVVNALEPAAVGMRSLTCKITHLVTFGAFSLAAPERLPACPAGGLSILNVKTMDREGHTVMASIGPVGGGAGGNPWADGVDASGANIAFMRNTPVEINEAEVPIRITRYGIAPDTAGAGQYRGGLGTVMEFKVFSPNTVVTARNRDRSQFASWGVLGGQAGAVSRFTRNPDTPSAEELGNTDLVPCNPGDVIRLVGGGAGGYGEPTKRDPRKVLEDVRRRYVSVETARHVYAVAIEKGSVNPEETGRLRAEAATRHGGLAEPHFHFGAYRDAFEAKWTLPRYDALTSLLAGVPVSWRYFLKHSIFNELDRRIRAGTVEDGAQVVHEIFETLLGIYPELRQAS